MKQNIRKFLCFTISIVMIFIFVSCNNGKSRTLKFTSSSYNGISKLTASELNTFDIQSYYNSNNKKYSCHVIIKDNILYIEKDLPDNDNILMVGYGYFTGINLGEFAGGVIYMPYGLLTNELNNAQIVTDEQFFKFEKIDNNKAYLLTGLNHMSTNYGSLYKLELIDSLWVWEKTIDLGSEPLASIMYENILYIITEKGILKIENNVLVENLIDDLELWHDLFPNSVVALNGSLYIGMNMGVYEYNLQTNEQYWYPMDFSKLK